MPTFLTGGTERLVSDLIQRLDARRFEASACVFHNGLLGEELAARGYAVHCLVAEGEGRGRGIRRVAGVVRRVAALHRLIEGQGIDVVHSHFLGPALHACLARMRSRRWRWVHTEHARPDLIAEYPRWLRHAGGRVMRAADVVTAVSDEVASYIRERGRVAPSRVRVIGNGIDVNLFAKTYDREAKRREIGVPAGAWVIGTVGNLRVEKNHELALRALVEVSREAADVNLVLAGDGERREHLEGLARDLGLRDRVRFLGARLDVPELFAAFDVYCLPSHFEGLPLSLLEAMAARKPIVGTRVAGIEGLIVDGVTGLLSPANDPPGLGRTLLRLYRDRALGDRLIDAGWRHVNAHARLETMVERYAALYENLSERARGAYSSPPRTKAT